MTAKLRRFWPLLVLAAVVIAALIVRGAVISRCERQLARRYGQAVADEAELSHVSLFPASAAGEYRGVEFQAGPDWDTLAERFAQADYRQRILTDDIAARILSLTVSLAEAAQDGDLARTDRKFIAYATAADGSPEAMAETALAVAARLREAGLSRCDSFYLYAASADGTRMPRLVFHPESDPEPTYAALLAQMESVPIDDAAAADLAGDAADAVPEPEPEPESPEPDPEPEADPGTDSESDADDNPIFALAPTRAKLYAACVEEALSGEPVRLSLAPEDCDWIDLIGWIIYPTGDDQWRIQTAEKQTILTSLISESDWYLCPDDFPALTSDCRHFYSLEGVMFLSEGEQQGAFLSRRCIMTDMFGVYICWDGEYYVPTAERGEEIRQTVTDMALALRDYIQEIALTYEDKFAEDPFFILPINYEDTADAF